MVIQERSRKSYTLLVAYHLTMFGYSTINRQINHFYGIATF